MARAFKGAVEFRVTVDRDLGDSWAVAAYPSNGQRPLVVKLQGNDKAAITAGALQILQDRGEIDRFEA
jgi:hypothetical protein